MNRSTGLSLIEVMATVVVIGVGFLGLSSLLVVNHASARTAEQEFQVTNFLRAQAERVRATPFEMVAATHAGQEYTIAELEDGICRVVVFVDETDDSTNATTLGLPRDLDGDGLATSTNVSANYVLLPVLIEIDWNQEGRQERRQLSFFLSQGD